MTTTILLPTVSWVPTHVCRIFGSESPGTLNCRVCPWTEFITASHSSATPKVWREWELDNGLYQARGVGDLSRPFTDYFSVYEGVITPIHPAALWPKVRELDRANKQGGMWTPVQPAVAE